jgi:hypothetical protein
MTGFLVFLIAGFLETLAATGLFFDGLVSFDRDDFAALEALKATLFLPLDGLTRDGLFDDDLATWTPCSFHRDIHSAPYIPTPGEQMDRTVFDNTAMRSCQ